MSSAQILERQLLEKDYENGSVVGDLIERANHGVSGEFICASQTAEVHVHLQSGRIAWATDSRHAFVFTRHLQENAKLAKTQLRALVDECRRRHLPLGETLIARNLATLEEVRAALRNQISRALLELSGMQDGTRVFLDRTREYQPYAAELTFETGDFSDELASIPATGDWKARGLMRQIRDAVNEVIWLEVMDDERVTAQDPAGTAPRVSTPLLRSTLLDGASLLTLRASRGTLIGVSLHNGRTLWCRLGVEAIFGAAVSALSAAAGFERASPDTARPPLRSKAPWTLGDPDCEATRELSEFLERAPELVATLVKAPLATKPILGVGRERILPDWCLDIVKRRSVAFELTNDLFADDPIPDAPDLEALGFHFKSLASAEADYWCLGAELSTIPGASAWLFIERRANQGLGWAYLSALQRRLDALRAESFQTQSHIEQ